MSTWLKNTLTLDELFEHVCHMVKLRFAVPLFVVHAVVEGIKPLGIRVVVHTGDHANTHDRVVGVAGVLFDRSFDNTRGVLVHGRVVKQDAAFRAVHDNIRPAVLGSADCSLETGRHCRAQGRLPYPRSRYR